MPRLSIILPVYNGANFLVKCIESILGNTYKDFELIIVNDGSTDDTAEICNGYARQDSRVIVHHNSNQGVSYSRNFGIDHAKGEWISFIDADDRYTPDAFQTIIYEMTSNAPDMICFGFRSISKDCENVICLPEVRNGKFTFMREQMLHGWTVVWNTFFKKDLIDRHALRFNEGISIGEDFELLFRAYYYAKIIKVIDKPLYYYNRMNEESALHKMTVRQYDEIIKANTSVASFFNEKGILDKFRDIVAWKILRAKQDYILDTATHNKFLAIYPECHRYILSCPTINRKIKLMMWLLTHRAGWITRAMVRVRNRIKRDI